MVIVLFLSMFISATILMWLFNYFVYDKKFKVDRKFLLTTVLLTCVSVFIKSEFIQSMTGKSYTPIILSLILYMLIVYVVYKASMDSILLWFFITLLISYLCEILALVILFLIGFTPNMISVSSTATMLTIVLTLSLFWMLSFILKERLKKLFRSLLKALSGSRRRRLIYYIQLVVPLIIVVFIITFYANTVHINLFSGGKLVLVISITLLYIVFSLFATNAVIKGTLKLQELEEQKDYVNSFNTVLDDVREFWHGYTNMVQVISTCLDDNTSYEETKQLLKAVMENHETSNISTKVSLSQIRHPVLAGILSNSMHYGKLLGVNLTIKSLGYGTLDINMLDLTTVLGILLNNAIEVACCSDIKMVDVALMFDSDFVTITIFNSVTTEDNKVLKHGESHGVGLKQLTDIVELNPSLEYEETAEQDFHIAILKVGLAK